MIHPDSVQMWEAETAAYRARIATMGNQIDHLQRIVDFVALWCYRKTLAGDHERLSVIAYHPGIKAAAKAAGLISDDEQSGDRK